MNSPEIQKAYADYDREDSIANSKVGCALAIVLMPLGSFTMDFFTYRNHLWDFFQIRLVSSILTLIVLILLMTKWGERHYRFLRMAWYWIPLLFIACMIYAAQDPKSPYYAGFNLVLMAVGVVLPWTYLEILATSVAATVIYIGIVLFSGWGGNPILANNLFFLGCTATIVVTGSYFHSRLRFREFSLRFELDKNRKSLEESNRKLIELDQLKSRFFANVSHELRTPLTLLLAPLENLVKRFDGSSDQGLSELLHTMHANGMRLLKLINDLLELIRLEAGRLEIKSEPLHVADFINGIASSVRQMASEKQITLEIHTDAELGTVLADHSKLEKILLNLLFNALKFTPPSGRVWLRAEKQGHELVLIVGDTGVGIAEKSLPYVFDRFWQEDGSSKRKFQGVGIGLALVKEMAETLNGTVGVQSQLERGTTFTVKLPLKKADAAPAPMTAKAEPGDNAVHSEEWLANLYRRAEFFPVTTAKRNNASGSAIVGRRTQRPLVLVADDEPDMRRFLASQLMDDYELVEAADGQQATEKAQEFLPDVILLDLMMPHKDGLQVCRELRAYASTAGIPIILLTARADEEVKFDALQMGANDFLAKPFSSTELQARIKNLIESHHYQRKLTKQNEALSNAIEQIKETEMQLVQSEKLSSLGRMSAGIIHEINNPLNFSLTGLFALRNKAKKMPAEERADYDAILNDVEEGLKRVRNIVSDLRTFTHPGGGTGEPVDAADAADAAVRFLGGEWKEFVEIHQEIPPTQGLWANRNKLIHVLVNLLQNGIDALRDKKFADNERPKIWIRGLVEGERSKIVIRDNGPGIDPKIADKIFDPFFTTKEVGKGMGLGLSICYRIVHGYGGKIFVKSEPGKFCEFTLDFPANAEAAAEMEIEHGEPLRL